MSKFGGFFGRKAGLFDSPSEPTPANTATIAFGGPNKKMLYAIQTRAEGGKRFVDLIGIQMIAQGYKGRPK